MRKAGDSLIVVSTYDTSAAIIGEGVYVGGKVYLSTAYTDAYTLGVGMVI